MGVKPSKAMSTGDPKLSNSDHNDKIQEFWQKRLLGSKCPILKVERFVSKDLEIIVDKPNGDAKYFIYTGVSPSKETQNSDGDQNVDEYDDEELAKVPFGIYLPIMETDATDSTYEQIVVLWDPRISMKDNFNGTHYLINEASESIIEMDCVIFQLGYGTAKEEMERREMIEQLSSSAMTFKWEKRFQKKFIEATTTDKDIFILNKRRRLEFFSWSEVKNKRRIFKHLDECLSVYLQMYPKEFGNFYVDVL